MADPANSEFPVPLTLGETARRIGHYRWIEMRLFEILGGWVGTVPELEVKLRLGEHCFHHSWHSELWSDRLPDLGELTPRRLTVPPNDTLLEFCEVLGGPGADQTIERLVGVYRVLIPHKIAAYTHHLRSSSPATDAPTIRSLRLVLQDEISDWRDGELLIQWLVDSGEKVQRAATHQARLQALLVEAGGVGGGGSLGAPPAAGVGGAHVEAI